MYQNDVVCDLYIGKNVGNKILQDLDNAKTSVKIISPYLSPSTIWQLIKLHRKGIKVELITTDSIMEQTENAEKTFKSLVQQKKEFSKKRAAFKKIYQISMIVFYLISAITSLSAFAIYNTNQFEKLTLIIFIAIASLVIAIFLTIKNSKTYSFVYQYSTIFPIKILIAPENSIYPIQTFIHSKVYIIDEKMMYWGSLNFTNSGMKDNYETRIKTLDAIAIEKMSREFNQLLQSTNLPEKHLKMWGRMIYSLDKKD